MPSIGLAAADRDCEDSNAEQLAHATGSGPVLILLFNVLIRSYWVLSHYNIASKPRSPSLVYPGTRWRHKVDGTRPSRWVPPDHHWRYLLALVAESPWPTEVRPCLQCPPKWSDCAAGNSQRLLTFSYRAILYQLSKSRTI